MFDSSMVFILGEIPNINTNGVVLTPVFAVEVTLSIDPVRLFIEMCEI